MEEDGLGSDPVLRLFKKRQFSSEGEGYTTTASMGEGLGHIDAIIGGLELTAFRFTSFYENPDMRLRKHSWDLLQWIADDVTGPWLVGDDFNEIIVALEYLGRRFRAMSQMRDFGAALEDCGLLTVGFRGYKLTWSNRWKCGGNVKLHLDRMVANDLMFLAFPDMLTHHLNSVVLDHIPILTGFRLHSWARRKRCFMFKEL
ncbi:hypothetical protein L3X38_032989 [Prunus dulcis]|uniref:Uncharacterized protein n=1 Tax=Prunus dulcis TaxID=3755 RepID=A0AAD4YWE4_PRUDU|nr:hypothetical protein L3X38_032989 [Prunus dulcis]